MNPVWHASIAVLALTNASSAAHTPHSPASVGLTDASQAPAAPAPAKPADSSVQVTWKDGLRFESADKSFKAKLGGRLFFDSAFTSTDDEFEAAFGTEEDGSRFRTARIYMEGELNERIEYKWQYDMAGGVNNRFKDVFIGLKGLPVGTLRVGQYKEPFSLEELTSSNHITFLERGGPNRLAPSRNIGVSIQDHNEAKTLTWAVGLFRDDGTDTGDDTGDGEYSLTGRITGTPWKRDATHLAHLGAAYSMRALRDQNYAVSSRGESGVTQNNVVSATVAADSVDLAGLEAAWVHGPFSIQGEYIQSAVEPSTGSDVDFSGAYLFLSWFLTGESRAYKDSAGMFQRIQVAKPYGVDGGMGALELALRYSTLDLDDGAVAGGQVDSATLGANWYLNNYTRLMFNYVHEEIEPGAGADASADILTMRLAIEF